MDDHLARLAKILAPPETKEQVEPTPIDPLAAYFKTMSELLGVLDTESKLRHVRDSAYWGMPDGTPIVPGMKPISNISPGEVRGS